MNIKQVISQYEASFRKIQKYFDNDTFYSAELWLDRWWRIDGGGCDLTFSDEEFGPDDDAECGEEIGNSGKMFWRKDEYSLAYIQDCFGDSYYVILDNLKEVKESESEH